MADAPLQNSVTRDDLRDALAAGPRRRPTGLLSPRREEPGSQPAWDWDAAPSTTDALELEELRGVTAEQREHIERLSAAKERSAAAERELRVALAELAGASLFRRRAVVASLRERGLI